MTPLIDLLQASPTLFSTVVLVFGLVVGSFLNVVIHRLPIMLEKAWRAQCAEHDGESEKLQPGEVYNLVVPRSRCVNCGHRISALENIPVFSYLVLRGRCHACGAHISARYLVVEILTGVLSVIVAWHFGFGLATVAALLLTWSLIALSAIDIEHQLLPDAVTLPFIWLGLAFSLFDTFVASRTAIIGALAGYLSLWAVYQLFRLVTGKEGMGYGDFKLLAMLGAWLGWQTLPLIILLSSVVGAVAGLGLIVFRQHKSQIPIPFGPYLAAAGWIAMLWGHDLTNLYLHAVGLA